MDEVLLVAEDDAQERLIGALILRVARESHRGVQLRIRSAYGGLPRVLREVAILANEIDRGHRAAPAIVVVAVDANCKGTDQRVNEIRGRAGTRLSDRLVAAIPDPHVERWYLLDGAAFKAVLGRGCDAPDKKCEKDRYKRLLNDAIRGAGVEPLLGGAEYAEDLVAAMHIGRAANADPAFRAFVDVLRTALNR
jgi:hypothetical protein